MKHWLSSILRYGIKESRITPKFQVSKAVSYDEYNIHANNEPKVSVEHSLILGKPPKFTVPGYCYVCKTSVKFLVDFKYCYLLNNVMMPNWRERLVCPHCQLINRHRATIHLFEQEFLPKLDARIYITEQVTPLYSLLKKKYPNIIGSEYMGDTLPNGACNNNGIRNEDFTNLSFEKDELDHILSFDVLEHIPKYRNALLECFRCLKPGGSLLFSVPFHKNSEKNIIRARINEDGKIEHILPPEYHGDPMSSEGILCYNSFGWELLDDLRSIGFVDVQALFYWSKELGYLGGDQVQFKAIKPDQ